MNKNIVETPKIDNIVEILQRHKQLKATKYLPTPQWVQSIIIHTNEGKFRKALNEIENSKRVFLSIENEMTLEDKEWYADILKRLLDSILSAKNSS